ncbi:hypothetical protein ACF0H5_018299 [Mactra antiquata]
MPKLKAKRRPSKEPATPYKRKKTAKDEADRSISKSKNKKTVPAQKRSASFTWFMKVYKGLNDWHLPIFEAVNEYTQAKQVLYPGCDKHLTASLIFHNVVYVDLNKKLEPVFKDPLVLEWINKNKKYSDEARLKFVCKSFESNFENTCSFDLMISACAGIVSTPCSKFLKVGGHFLVSDMHFDARTTFVRTDYRLVGLFDSDTNKLETSPEKLKGHFTTTSGSPITKRQVEESINKPKNRRSFTLQKEENFYLFKKIK